MSTSATPMAPNDLDAERALLGAMLVSPAAIDAAISEAGVRPDDFYRDAHRLVFDAIVALYRRAEPVDHVSVTAALREAGTLEAAGGDGATAILIGELPAAGHVRHYARLVRDLARSRAVLTMTYEVQTAIFEGRPPSQTIPLAENTLLALTAGGPRGVVRNIADVAWAELERLEQASRDGHGATGIDMPFGTIRDRIGGMQPMNLIVLCGRPGMGKSVVGQTIAEHAAFKLDKTVLFVTLEMSAEELAQRYLADHGNVSQDVLRRAQLTRAADITRLGEAVQRAAGKKFLLHEGIDMSVSELRAVARKTAAREGGIDLVVVDYLQLLSSGPGGRRRGESRTEEVGGFADGLKTLARELDCPVLALAQLNRAVELRNDKRPLLSDLRESGAIEQSADVVFSVYRGDYYDPDNAVPGETELAVLKNRHGAVGVKALLDLDGPHLRVTDQPSPAFAGAPYS